jgi:hypothetical protein
LTFSLSAQTSTKLAPISDSEELVELLDEIKAVAFKAYKERDKSLAKQIEAQKKALDSLENYFDALADYEIIQDQQLDSLTQMLNIWRRKTRNTREKVVFKIQFWMARQHPIDVLIRPKFFFHVDKTPYGTQFYMLGNFLSYQEARKFEKWLKKKGLDCYLVGYQQGRRVPKLGVLIDK